MGSDLGCGHDCRRFAATLVAKGRHAHVWTLPCWCLVSLRSALCLTRCCGVEAINPAATGYLGGLNWGGENYKDSAG